MENERTSRLDIHPPRVLDAPLLTFDLRLAMDRLKHEDVWMKEGHNSITLMKNHGMRIVMTALRQQAEIKPHQTKSTISIQVIEGKLNLITENDSIILKKGHLLTLHANISHSLRALKESIILQTIAL